jgi:hypothetical protein
MKIGVAPTPHHNFKPDLLNRPKTFNQRSQPGNRSLVPLRARHRALEVGDPKSLVAEDRQMSFHRLDAGIQFPQLRGNLLEYFFRTRAVFTHNYFFQY